MRRIALVASCCLFAAGCGKMAARPTIPTRTGPPPPTQTTTTIPSPGTVTLKVYLLRDGLIAAGQRVVPATQRVASAAVGALVHGPTAEERGAGFESSVPQSVSDEQISIADGVAYLNPTPDVTTGGEAQIVFTLTQFPTVRAVDWNGKELNRSDFESSMPAIFVESPVVGETVTSPLHLLGTANTFEASFQVELRVGGRRLIKGTVTATSGSGTRGTFDVSLPFKFDHEAEGVVLAYELSAKNGRPVNVVRVPVTVKPS